MAQMTAQNKRDTLTLWGVRVYVLEILEFKSYQITTCNPLTPGATVLAWNDDKLEWRARQAYLNEDAMKQVPLEYLTPTMLAALDMAHLLDKLNTKFINVP